MSDQDSNMSQQTLLAVFCQEIKERLGRVHKLLEQGVEGCDYEAVYQEFDSLQGGARAVNLAWLEEYGRALAGYARFLGRLRQGELAAKAHALLGEMARELAEQCRHSPRGEWLVGSGPERQASELLLSMGALMKQAKASEASPCTHLPHGRPLVLLVVDDSSTSRLLFNIHLPPEAGCRVFEAEDAEGALRQALAQHPDVVFLDYNMPDANGVEIARRIRAANLDPCFILLTANVQQAVLEEARETGFVGVLEKPVTRAKIAAILQRPSPE